MTDPQPQKPLDPNSPYTPQQSTNAPGKKGEHVASQQIGGQGLTFQSLADIQMAARQMGGSEDTIDVKQRKSQGWRPGNKLDSSKVRWEKPQGGHTQSETRREIQQ